MASQCLHPVLQIPKGSSVGSSNSLGRQKKFFSRACCKLGGLSDLFGFKTKPTNKTALQNCFSGSTGSTLRQDSLEHRLEEAQVKSPGTDSHAVSGDGAGKGSMANGMPFTPEPVPEEPKPIENNVEASGKPESKDTRSFDISPGFNRGLPQVAQSDRSESD